MEKIHWAPMIKTNIPDTFEFVQQSNKVLTPERETFVHDIEQLIDETRIAALSCDSVS